MMLQLQFNNRVALSSCNRPAEVLYDISSGRYSVMGLKNEEAQSIVFGAQTAAARYTPASLRRVGVR
ncbi:DUF1329 domain-containing protein [Stutzerimonas chloritidismutans]|uniref:DUF1329 domain-containing protein n=1 Tax=Stutzerimonas chloritidismutans TaxID=203192 RepID=UPI0012ECA2C0